MKRIPFSSAATPAALIALLMFAMPGGTAAQGARNRGSAPAQGHAVQRGQGGQGQSGQAAAPQGAQRAAPPAGTQRTAPSQQNVQPRSPAPRRNPPLQSVAPPRVVQPSIGTAVPRSAPRVVRPNNDHPIYRSNYGPGYGQTYRPAYRPAYRPVYPSYRPVYRPVYRPNYGAYYRPYYTFQPRLHLDFGLWVGVPVAYPYYMYPAASYPYAYTNPQPVYPTTGSSVNAAGGLSFDITPSDARIYVDEQYFGIAAQYTPTDPPLSLAPGRHHVEIHASGFEVIAFDVDILPGQVIPYQGDLQRF